MFAPKSEGCKGAASPSADFGDGLPPSRSGQYCLPALPTDASPGPPNRRYLAEGASRASVAARPPTGRVGNGRGGRSVVDDDSETAA